MHLDGGISTMTEASDSQPTHLKDNTKGRGWLQGGL